MSFREKNLKYDKNLKLPSCRYSLYLILKKYQPTKKKSEAYIMKKSLLFIFSTAVIPAFLFSSCATTTAKTENRSLEKEVSGLQQQLSQEKLAEKQEEVKAKETYDQLYGGLKDEIQKGQVTIDQYKNALTINIMDQIFFRSGSAIIKKSGYKVLDHVGKIIANLKNKVVKIEGYTDNVPIAASYRWKFRNNWDLGARRAVSVATYFQKKFKIDPRRIEVVSYSKYRPEAPNTTPANRAKNRRIEIVLVNKALYQKMVMKEGIK
jgi:flagellar motor protein MotB